MNCLHFRHYHCPISHHNELRQYLILFLGTFHSFYVARPHLISARNAPLQLDWRRLYRERFVLEKRWAGPARHTAISFQDESTMHTRQGFPNVDPRSKWEPKVMRIPGHSDRYVT